MPQMKPHYWLFMLIFLTTLLMIMMNLIYFTYFIMDSHKFSPTPSNKKYWYWKW